jgi:hypothetical protein
MKDTNKMGQDRVLGLFSMSKVENIVGNGIKTKWKEEEHYTILMVNLLTRANGAKTNCTDMEYYITKLLIMSQQVWIGRN